LWGRLNDLKSIGIQWVTATEDQEGMSRAMQRFFQDLQVQGYGNLLGDEQLPNNFNKLHF
jgi:hypothetical protein